MDKEQSYYETHAAEYARRWNTQPVGAMLERFTGMLAGEALILDAGCGTGRDLALLAGSGFRMVGVDYSTGMLAEARKLFDGPLTAGDLRDLPFGDDTFDGVWAMASLVHLNPDDTRTALSELHRVVKADGVVYVSVKTKASPDERHFTLWTLEDLVGVLLDSDFVDFDVSPSSGRGADWLDVFAWPEPRTARDPASPRTETRQVDTAVGRGRSPARDRSQVQR